MVKEDHKNEWRQHFPTYHFSERDIALEEYKVAAKNLESEERVFLNASNMTLVSSAALGSLVVGYFEKLALLFDGVISAFTILVILLSMVLSFSFVSLRYFADRQNSIVFSGRKIIILRRMLGLSYGKIQLLLPGWRVEGADEPLELKIFPGWLSYAAYPFWIISIISCSVIFFLTAYFIKQYPDIVGVELRPYLLVFLVASWLMGVMFVYRLSLLDAHENFRLIFYKYLARIIGLPLPENVEYIIYRARLAVYETNRLDVSTTNLEKFLVFVEDRGFYKHSGISYKSLVRSILGVIKIKPKSGGSTIVQQLVRTLFIKNMGKIGRRKFLELGLATWVTAMFSKQTILQIYISSVRFERGCFGVIQAMNHYFGKVEFMPSNAQSFFLIERVSNIRSKLLVNKIIDTARSAVSHDLLNEDDLKELSEIYNTSVINKKIIASDSDLYRLAEGLLR